MIDSASTNSLFDAKVFDVDGEKIGSVKQVFVGPDGGEPLFVSVATGLFGTSETFVPLRDATFDGEAMRVAYDKATVKDAPRIDADGSLSDDEHDRLWEYYGDEHDDRDDRDGRADDRSAPSDANGAVRAEHAAAPKFVTGRVPLRRHIVTEVRHGDSPEHGATGVSR
ncbi:PRC-barrel domain-containing protein [Leucobacter sp. USCH14]|uniref:PRC-barrel domain-containing protein n=1 Tax=Leucobacter sp. USCH14 TaxID=3024838 RepID=UPI0030B6C986